MEFSITEEAQKEELNSHHRLLVKESGLLAGEGNPQLSAEVEYSKRLLATIWASKGDVKLVTLGLSGSMDSFTSSDGSGPGSGCPLWEWGEG